MKRRRKKIEMWEIANIPDEIRFDAFYYQGSEFSRVYIFDGKITTRKERVFGGYKSPRVTDQTEAILQKMKTTLPAGTIIKYKKTETKKYEKTNYYNQNPFTSDNYLEEIEPIEVTVAVPKELSQKVFLAHPYVQDGFAFRDYLLKNRRDKLETIAKDDGRGWWDIIIGCDGVSHRGKAEYQYSTMHFSKLGLADLSSDVQMYGLALALLEVLGRKQSEITIDHASDGGLRVVERHIDIEPPKPVVEPW